MWSAVYLIWSTLWFFWVFFWSEWLTLSFLHNFSENVLLCYLAFGALKIWSNGKYDNKICTYCKYCHNNKEAKYFLYSVFTAFWLICHIIGLFWLFISYKHSSLCTCLCSLNKKFAEKLHLLYLIYEYNMQHFSSNSQTFCMYGYKVRYLKALTVLTLYQLCGQSSFSVYKCFQVFWIDTVF